MDALNPHIPSVENAKAANKAREEVGVLVPVVRGLITIFFAGIGIMIGATVSALAFPEPAGVGAICGGTVGCLLFGLIGTCASGSWRDLVPTNIGFAPSFIPHTMYSAVGKHGDFTLVLTVHSITTVKVKGKAPPPNTDFDSLPEPEVMQGAHVTNRLWNSPSLFVEIDCGENPTKQTCVNAKGEFQEQFKLQVKAADENVTFTVRDQQIMGSDVVGTVSLDIQKKIINKNFPKNQFIKWTADKNGNKIPYNEGAFHISGGGGSSTLREDKGKAFLNLSFDALDINTGESADQKSAILKSHVENDWKEYGAVSFLPSTQFNRDVTINYRPGDHPVWQQHQAQV